MHKSNAKVGDFEIVPTALNIIDHAILNILASSSADTTALDTL